MCRTVLACVFSVAVLLCSPSRLEAAAITQCDGSVAGCDSLIGTFMWTNDLDADGQPLGDLFTLINLSNDDFTSVVLVLGDSPLSEFPDLVSSTSGAIDSGGTLFLSPISSASLSFVYLGTTFYAPYQAGPLDAPGVVEIYAQAVPEPGTLALLATGAVALGLRGRRRPRLR